MLCHYTYIIFEYRDFNVIIIILSFLLYLMFHALLLDYLWLGVKGMRLVIHLM